MHPKSVIRLLSFITVFMAAILLIPLLVSLGYGEAEGVDAFARTIILMVFISLVGIILTHGCEMKVSVKDSYLFVTLTWVVLTFFGSSGVHDNHGYAAMAAEECPGNSISGTTVM